MELISGAQYGGNQETPAIAADGLLTAEPRFNENPGAAMTLTEFYSRLLKDDP
jgi:hypothetical protein